MSATQLVQATELFLLDEARQRILLGEKKSGLGIGKVLGIGGKVEAGETERAAAIREMNEETRVSVHPAALQTIADIIFLFPHKTSWSMRVHFFVSTEWHGTPTETDEIRPIWFPQDALPLDRMWDDTRYWLPAVLHRRRFLQARFVYASDNQTVEAHDLDWSAQ